MVHTTEYTLIKTTFEVACYFYSVGLENTLTAKDINIALDFLFEKLYIY